MRRDAIGPTQTEHTVRPPSVVRRQPTAAAAEPERDALLVAVNATKSGGRPKGGGDERASRTIGASLRSQNRQNGTRDEHHSAARTDRTEHGLNITPQPEPTEPNTG